MLPELLAGICFNPTSAYDQIEIIIAIKHNAAMKPIRLNVQLKREIRLVVCSNAFLHNNVPGRASIQLLSNHASDNNSLKTRGLFRCTLARSAVHRKVWRPAVTREHRTNLEGNRGCTILLCHPRGACQAPVKKLL